MIHNLTDFIEENTMLKISKKGNNDYIVQLIHTYRQEDETVEGAYEWVKCNMNNGKLKVRKGVYLSSSMYDGSEFCRKVKIGDKLIL